MRITSRVNTLQNFLVNKTNSVDILIVRFGGFAPYSGFKWGKKLDLRYRSDAVSHSFFSPLSLI